MGKTSWTHSTFINTSINTFIRASIRTLIVYSFALIHFAIHLFINLVVHLIITFLIHFLTHLYINLSIRLFIHAFIYTFIRAFFHAFIVGLSLFISVNYFDSMDGLSLPVCIFVWQIVNIFFCLSDYIYCVFVSFLIRQLLRFWTVFLCVCLYHE